MQDFWKVLYIIYLQTLFFTNKAALDLKIINKFPTPLLGVGGTYEQAVPGLFTAGTSSPMLCKGQKGKGRLQARIEIMVEVAFICNPSSIVLIPGSIKQIK
jgi:hypothetical protein